MAEGEDAELRRALDVVQSMIEISAERLEGLRTKCSTSAELTQQEIRTLEVGENNSRHEEELRRLCRALHNLRRYIDVLLEGDKDTDMNLYWDSWDRHQLRSGPSPRPVRSRTTRSSVPSEDSIPYHNNINVNNDLLSQSSSIICLTNSPPSTPRLNKHERANVKFPTTPPPNKKQSPQPPADVFPLTKSKSHESQLANRLENGETEHPRRIRLPTEPGSGTSNANIANDTLNISSPIKSPPYSSAENKDNVRLLRQADVHRNGFEVQGVQELFDEFKRTHQADSLANASPTLSKPGVTSPNHHHHHISNLLSSLNRKDRKRPHLHSPSNIPFTSADSSSTTSSCNSSTPSSPALLPGNQTTSQTISVNVTSTATSTHLPTVKQQFHFPEVTLNEKTLMVDGQHGRLDSTIMSSDSDKTVSVSGSGIHKDLKSKNIFLETGKVVITDFGLFSVTKLCYGNRISDGLSIPPGWLCYLSPEIVRRLRPQHTRDQEELAFTEASDVYAFGTVWYELLCGEWPFKGQPPEAIIWQVGKGMKQTLANLQASREVKVF
ncbi:hypothetical protein G9C98_004621, partial [Cotesia typhae]